MKNIIAAFAIAVGAVAFGDQSAPAQTVTIPAREWAALVARVQQLEKIVEPLKPYAKAHADAQKRLKEKGIDDEARLRAEQRRALAARRAKQLQKKTEAPAK